MVVDGVTREAEVNHVLCARRCSVTAYRETVPAGPGTLESRRSVTESLLICLDFLFTSGSDLQQ